MPGKESLREGEKYRAQAAFPIVLVRFRRFLFLRACIYRAGLF